MAEAIATSFGYLEGCTFTVFYDDVTFRILRVEAQNPNAFNVTITIRNSKGGAWAVSVPSGTTNYTLNNAQQRSYTWPPEGSPPSDVTATIECWMG